MRRHFTAKHSQDRRLRRWPDIVGDTPSPRRWHRRLEQDRHHDLPAGGPPHLDMYDLKPDAPKEYRGEFKPAARAAVAPRNRLGRWERPIPESRRCSERASRLAGHAPGGRHGHRNSATKSMVASKASAYRRGNAAVRRPGINPTLRITRDSLACPWAQEPGRHATLKLRVDRKQIPGDRVRAYVHVHLSQPVTESLTILCQLPASLTFLYQPEA